MGPHIVSAFDDDLIAVQGKISEMGGLAEELLRNALEAVQNRDAEMAAQVRERDKVLDALELELETMATRVIALRQPMAQDLRVLHGSRNAEQAVAIWKSDVKIDEMYNAIFREVVTYMMEDSRMIGLGSQLLFVAKNLERIGDHTTHVSEMIYYIVKGEPLGDDRPKGEPIGLDFE